MQLPLEDLFNDVIAKSMRGLGITDADLATRSGASATDIADAKAGQVNDAVLRQIAPTLQLDGPSLVAMAHSEWRPQPASVPGLEQFNTTYHDMTVNAYLVWDAETKNAIAFDTGADASPMINFIQEKGLNLSLIFITHTHGDHIADLVKLSAEGIVTTFVHEKEPCPGAKTFKLSDTEAWESGGLRIEPRSTCGHSKGGITYVVSGLQQTIAIVGDALFASSMGGGMVSFADALATNRKEIFTLPDSAVVCPGHGPMTTVGEEKKHNPFYPEFK